MSGELIQNTGVGPAGSDDESMAAVEQSIAVIADLHLRQAEMYAGGPMGPVAALLSDDVIWHVAGGSPIAGEHRGWDAVLQYFAAVREMAGETLRMRPQEVAAASREVVVQLVEGAVLLAGDVIGWRVAGLYRVERGRVREAWLVPLDLELFDRTWTALDRDGPARR